MRHPRSGTINTLYFDAVIDVNNVFREAVNASNYSSLEGLLTDRLDGFSAREVNFCVNPAGPGASSNVRRQNIRILANARNASDVEMINLDGEGNACN